MAIITWNTNTSYGVWSTATNWSNDTVPTSSSTVFIDSAGVIISGGEANADQLSIDSSLVIIAGNLVANTLDLSSNIYRETITLNAGTITANSITGWSSDVYISGYGVINGAISGNINLTADGGLLTINGSIDNSRPSHINSNSTLEINGSVTNNYIYFFGQNATLKLGNPAAFTTLSINGFDADDKIDLVGITASSASYNGTTLTINETNGQQLIYSNVSGAFSGYTPTVTSDGNGGTLISLAAPSTTNTWNTNATGDWSNASYWSIGTVPTASSTVIINSAADVSINGTATANQLTINSLVTIAGNLTVNTLNLNSVSFGGIVLNAGTITANSITGANSIFGHGVINGAIDEGRFQANDGLLTINGSISNNTSGYISSNSTLEINGSGTNSSIYFFGQNATLKLGNPAAFTSVSIYGFDADDKIDLVGITANSVSYIPGPLVSDGISATYEAGTLTINESNGQQLIYSGVMETRSGYTATVISDGNGGSLIGFASPAPTISSFSPTDNATGVAVGDNISVTFSEAIQRGIGAIVIYSGSASGTVVESFDAATNPHLVFSDNSLKIDPTADLASNTHYYLTFDLGSVKNLAGNSYVGTTTYNFTTETSDNKITDGNDVLIGTNASDTLNGGKGVDSMEGGLGNDTYFVDNTGDKVIEIKSAGTDTVNSSISYILSDNVENLILSGKSSLYGTGNLLNNNLIGNAGANILKGLAGNDLIFGGLGKDKFTGGAGKDTFDFNTSLEIGKGASRDSITDFSHRQHDRIDLSGIDANSKKAGNQAFSFIGSKEFDGKTGEIHFIKGVLSGDTNGDKVADFDLSITVVGSTTIKAQDFFL